VSEIFVESVQKAAGTFGMSPAFVGFIIVSLVGAAVEFAVAFTAARKDRFDMSVSIALGSASQIALFVAPALVLLSYVVGPSPMSLQFWPGAVTMVMIATVRELHYQQRALGLVRRRSAHLHLRGLCADAVCGPAGGPGDGVKPMADLG
jgi:Ca2+:H+ antiporter